MNIKRQKKKIEQITKMARINPNIIWDTRKRTGTDNELSYATITEEGTTITDPEKAKEHIAEYFEDLYQARPGTPEYENWTKYIETEVKKSTPICWTNKRRTRTNNPQGARNSHKKLKRKKSLGPDDIPNETFIEANKKTRDIFREAFNRIHVKDEIPKSWQLGHILRLYKGKGTKGKCSNERGITLASNPGKVFERIINERVKKEVQLTEAQAGGIPGNATCDHLIIIDQTIEEIRNDKKTAYIIFLDVQKAYDKAWLDGILHALHRNGVKGKNLILIKKLNSNLRARIHTRHGLTREIKIKDSIRQGGVLFVIEYATLIDEIAKELKKKQYRPTNKTRNPTEHPTVDGWPVPHPPRPDNSTENVWYHKPRRKKVPYRIWSSKMQGSENRAGPRKQNHAEQHDTGRGTQIQIPRKNIQHKRQPWRTPERPRNQNNDCHPENTSRNRGQRIQRDENESHLAMHRSHHHPNLNIWIRSMEPYKKGRRTDTKDIQHNPENDHEPTPGNPYNNTTEGIRIHTNQPWNKYKKNNASQMDWRKRRKLPNKR